MPAKKLFDDVACKQCEKLFNRTIYPSGRLESSSDFMERKFCSKVCYDVWNHGDHHWYWNGGVKNRPDGRQRRSRDDRYIYRIVMEEHLGRPLTKDEVVHHQNNDPRDNRIENLVLFANHSIHISAHDPERNRDSKGRYA